MKKKRSFAKTPPLGQHFLKGSWAAKKLADSVRISEDDIVVEIGPGTGILTSELLKRAGYVVAIEKDSKLVGSLRDTFADEIKNEKLKIIAADIRDISPADLGLKCESYILAANIPYYITGEILRMFLSSETQPRTLALLVQKEVAERILSAKESILSLSVKSYGKPAIAAVVKRGNFSPPPRVDSAILLVDSISRDFFIDMDERIFFSLVRTGFAAKRKLLASNLSSLFGSKERALQALALCKIHTDARAEDVPLEKWKCLTKKLIAWSG